MKGFESCPFAASWLVAYAQLNSTAFRKCVKRLDRKTRTRRGAELRNALHLPTAFLSGPILTAGTDLLFCAQHYVYPRKSEK